MKFTDLKIVNFRSHANTNLPLSRITVVRAENAAGKSSIEKAFAFALTGRTEETDARGAGAVDLIRSGADKSVIVLSGENGDTQRRIRCSLTAKSGRSIAAKDGNDVDVTAETVRWLAGEKELLSCLTSTRYFVNLKADEQRELLAQLVLPATHDWPEEIKSSAKDAGVTIDWQMAPLELISAAYKAAFEKRTGVNRAIKELRIPEGDTAAAGDPRELAAELGKLSSERDEIIRGQAKAKAELQAETQRRQVLTQRIESTTRMRAAEVGELTEAKQHLIKKGLDDLRKTAAKAKDADRINRQIVEAEARLKATRDLTKKIDGLSDLPKCPTCYQPIRVEEVAAVLAPLVESANKENDNITDLREQLASLGNYQMAADAIAAHDRAVEVVKRCEKRIAEYDETIQACRASEQEGGQITAAGDELSTAALAAVNQTIAEVQSKMTLMVTANAVKAQQDAASERLTSLNRQLVALEVLLAFFGPGPEGIRAQLLDQNFGEFQESINARLATWGYSCKLSFEPYGFFIRHHGAPERNLRTLSRSEQYRFAIAFQVALSLASGLNFAVIDEADMLDSDGRGGLMEMLLDSELEQAIVLMTDEREEVPDVEGVAFWQLAVTPDTNGIGETAVRRLA